MSLINDMLRDLDARRVHSTAGNQAALSAASTGNFGAGRARPGITRLLAGPLLLVALALTMPLVTDHLEVFDWSGSGTSSVTRKITLPAPAKHRAAHRTRAEEVHTRALPKTIRIEAPAMAPLQSVAPDNGSPPVTETDTVMPSVPDGTETDEPATGTIVLRHHGAGDEYRLAAGAAAAGNDREAIRRLELLLTGDTGHNEATLLLASLYIRQQQLAQAESLLTDALARQPLHVPYARLLANLLVAQKRHGDAITHLLTALPGASRDAAYQALLAGLYQHIGEPATAVTYYTRALALSPEQGEWWMGLGISREQAGKPAAAYTAYRKALQFRLDVSLRDYINERLRMLAQQGATNLTNTDSKGKG